MVSATLKFFSPAFGSRLRLPNPGSSTLTVALLSLVCLPRLGHTANNDDFIVVNGKLPLGIPIMKDMVEMKDEEGLRKYNDPDVVGYSSTGDQFFVTGCTVKDEKEWAKVIHPHVGWVLKSSLLIDEAAAFKLEVLNQKAQTDKRVPSPTGADPRLQQATRLSLVEQKQVEKRLENCMEQLPRARKEYNENTKQNRKYQQELTYRNYQKDQEEVVSKTLVYKALLKKQTFALVWSDNIWKVGKVLRKIIFKPMKEILALSKKQIPALTHVPEFNVRFLGQKLVQLESYTSSKDLKDGKIHPELLFTKRRAARNKRAEIRKADRAAKTTKPKHEKRDRIDQGMLQWGDWQKKIEQDMKGSKKSKPQIPVIERNDKVEYKLWRNSDWIKGGKVLQVSKKSVMLEYKKNGRTKTTYVPKQSDRVRLEA